MCYTLSLTVERAKNRSTFCSHSLAVRSESNSKRACSTKIVSCVKQDGGHIHACMHYSSIATDNWHVRDVGTTWSFAHTDSETMRKKATKSFLKEKRKLARGKPLYVLGTNPEPQPHHCTCQDYVQNSQASDPLWRVGGGLSTSRHVQWAEAYCEALCSATSQLLHNE